MVLQARVGGLTTVRTWDRRFPSKTASFVVFELAFLVTSLNVLVALATPVGSFEGFPMTCRVVVVLMSLVLQQRLLLRVAFAAVATGMRFSRSLRARRNVFCRCKKSDLSKVFVENYEVVVLNLKSWY